MDGSLSPLISLLPPWAQTALICFLILSYLAGHFCSNTAKPPPNTLWGKIYGGIEVFGGIYNKAKEVGIPVPPKPTVEELLQRIAELEAKARGKTINEDVVPIPSTVSPTQPADPLPDTLINGSAPAPAHTMVKP